MPFSALEDGRLIPHEEVRQHLEEWRERRRVLLDLFKKHRFVLDADGCGHGYLSIELTRFDEDGFSDACRACVSARIRELAADVKQAGLTEDYNQLAELAASNEQPGEADLPVFYI